MDTNTVARLSAALAPLARLVHKVVEQLRAAYESFARWWREAAARRAQAEATVTLARARVLTGFHHHGQTAAHQYALREAFARDRMCAPVRLPAGLWALVPPEGRSAGRVAPE